MDVIFEVNGRFRITFIPIAIDRVVREPFLVNYREEGAEKAEWTQLPPDLFSAIVGCATPEIFHLMRPYLVEEYSMSDGMLQHLLDAPRNLAEFAKSEDGSIPSGGRVLSQWLNGEPKVKGYYLWRAAPRGEVHEVKVFEQYHGNDLILSYDCLTNPAASYEDLNKGQWRLL